MILSLIFRTPKEDDEEEEDGNQMNNDEVMMKGVYDGSAKKELSSEKINATG